VCFCRIRLGMLHRPRAIAAVVYLILGGLIVALLRRTYCDAQAAWFERSPDGRRRRKAVGACRPHRT
jgi:hypothetical protein